LRLKPSHDINRDLGTSEVDTQIAALNLRSIVPQQLNYLSDDSLYDTTKPFHTRLPFLGEIRRSNITGQGYSGIKIHDLSGHEDTFTLDTSGFQYLRIPTAVTNWTKEATESHYLPEMETWLKDFFGAESIHIYAYTVSRDQSWKRQRSDGCLEFRCNNRENPLTEHWAGPFTRAHCGMHCIPSPVRLHARRCLLTSWVDG
jgi:hypothetical protein